MFCSCDGTFIDSLRRYVDCGLCKDASVAAADGTDMKYLRKLLDEIASDLNKCVALLVVGWQQCCLYCS